MTFPEEENDAWDQLRIHIYCGDFSRRPHGNPQKQVDMPDDGWCMRFTPYGTRHAAQWSRIIKWLWEHKPERARKLLASLAELPGSEQLGGKGGSCSGAKLHPQQMRAGRAPEPELEEGTYAQLLCAKDPSVVLSEGIVIQRNKDQRFVGKIQVVPGVHLLRAKDVPPRNARKNVSI